MSSLVFHIALGVLIAWGVAPLPSGDAYRESPALRGEAGMLRGTAGVPRTTPALLRGIPDSVRILNGAQQVMTAYVRDGRRLAQHARDRNLPVDAGQIQEARPRVIEALDEAARELPGDDWLAGHRVGLRVKADRLDEALELATECQATPWWCSALEGFVRHVEGDSLATHEAYERAIDEMPPDVLCQWQEELGEVLVGELRGRYRGADCEELAELAPRVWWLADPFHLLPWNDWRSEHLSRLVGMRLHHESLALVGERCTPGHHVRILAEGWPAWWWGYDSRLAPGPAESHVFLPPSEAVLRPFETNPWSWDLRDNPYRERADLGYDLIHGLDQQTAFFARGDSVLVVASAEMHRHILRGEPRLTTGIVLTVGVGEETYSARQEGAPEHLRFRLMAPRDTYLVSVESIADTWGAARTRFGHRLPEASPTGLALSDLLFFEWAEGEPREGTQSEGARSRQFEGARSGEDWAEVGRLGEIEDDLEAILPRMLGTHRISSDREVGIFWETYGWPEGAPLELSIRVLDTEEGFFRRLGRALRLVGRSEAVRTSWTEPPPEPGGPDVVGRSLRLDLSQLEPGRYLLELQARIGDDEPTLARRYLEVDWR